MAEPWFPRSTPATVAASNAAAQQAALNEIAQSTNATEEILSVPSPLPVGGATEATQQANQAALGTEGGGVVVPPPGGGTGILGWIRSLREYFQEMYSIVGAQRAIKVDVIQTVGGSGGGDATAANQVAGNASLTSIDGKIPALVGGRIPVVLPAGGSGLTDTELRATPVPISGTVATGGLTDAELRASAVPVSFPGAVAVTGPLTDAQLRLSPVPISGTITTGGLTDVQLRATPVPVSGTVATTGGLTDTELRAVPVPVSGTVATGGITDAQLRAVPVPVSGTVTTGGLTDAQLRASDVPVAVSSLPKSASSNVPSIVVAGGDVIALNASRKAWGVQNLGINTLYVRMATGASSTVFHFALAGGDANDDGRGGSIQDDVYTGVVSATGTSPRFTVYEL